MACITFLLGSTGLDLASLQSCELHTMIPILWNRKSRLTNIFKVTHLIPGAASICSQIQAPEHMFSSLGLDYKSHWSEVHFPFWVWFLSGLGLIMPEPPWGVFPTEQLFLGSQRERWCLAPFSVRVSRFSTQPGGQGLINEEPYWRHLGAIRI